MVATLICCMNCSAHSFHAHLLPSRWPESMSLPLVLQLFLQHFKSFLNPTVHWWGSHNLLSWASGVFMWEMTRSKSKCHVLTLSHILHLYSWNSRLIFFCFVLCNTACCFSALRKFYLCCWFELQPVLKFKWVWIILQVFTNIILRTTKYILVQIR